jgi:hypothetical protein
MEGVATTISDRILFDTADRVPDREKWVLQQLFQGPKPPLLFTKKTLASPANNAHFRADCLNECPLFKLNRFKPPLT